MSLPVVLALYYVGLAIFSFYQHQPTEMRPATGDLALYQFIATELPSPLPGLILASMLAAVMSTLDSGINSLATVATKDVYARFIRPDASEDRQVRFSRWMTVLTGSIAVACGLGLSRLNQQTGESVLETSLMWLSMSVALPPVFLLGVFSRRARARHALITLLFGWGLTTGMITFYLYARTTEQPISHMFVVIPALVLGPIVGYLISRRSPRRPNAELQDMTLFTLTR
jgi:SSS family solute:Na+ symporter